MRYLLAIGGLLLGAAAIFALLLLLPRDQSQPPGAGALVSSAAAQAPAQPLSAEPEGGGSLRVCNQTRNPVSIAFGYRAERGWRSEGWWVAQADECKILYTGDLGARRYYYLYAADDISGGAWEGNVYMCTRDESFTIFDVDDCLARGYERTGFFEIDTNRASDWTVRLTENQGLGAEPVDGTDADAPLEGELGDDAAGQPAGDEPAEGESE